MEKPKTILFVSTLFSIALVIPSTSALLQQYQSYNPSPSIIPSLNNNKLSQIFSKINETLLREYLQKLIDCEPRRTGTYGCEQAAAYIYQQFNTAGLETRYHNWTARGNKYNPILFHSQNVEGIYRSKNLSSSSLILFSAHYDTGKNTPGANDDGTGTAAVLAAASVLSQFEFRHPLCFVAFSGEEEGTLGSHAYVKEAYQQNRNIVVDIQADMIGHADAPVADIEMWFSVTEDAQWILPLITTVGEEAQIPFPLSNGLINRDGHAWSDHFSFVEYGYEAIGCYAGSGDPNMHTPNDDMDNINFSFFVNTTRVLLGTLALLADSEELYPQVRIVSPQRGHLYFEGRPIRAISDLQTIVINDIWIWADVNYETTPILRAEFYYDNKLVYTDTEPPFKWQYNKFSLRTHRITIITYDILGRKSTDLQDIRFINLLKKR